MWTDLYRYIMTCLIFICFLFVPMKFITCSFQIPCTSSEAEYYDMIHYDYRINDQCSESMRVGCSEALDMYPEGYPDIFYCSRMLIHIGCTGYPHYCKETAKAAYNYYCCGQPDIQDCNTIVQKRCGKSPLKQPGKKVDRDYCKKIRDFQSCAQYIDSPLCENYFKNLYFSLCRGYYLPEDCMENFIHVCHKAVKMYPFTYPDHNFCRRLKALRNCAKTESSGMCANVFIRIRQRDCNSDQCLDKYNKLYPSILKSNPIMVPDNGYCVRIASYYARVRDHICSEYFSDILNYECSGRQSLLDCESYYLFTCPNAMRLYPKFEDADLNYCPRLNEYLKCASNDKSKGCILHFAKLIERSCHDVDENNCDKKIKETCKEAVQHFPVEYPDEMYCLRMSMATTCVNESIPECKTYHEWQVMDKCDLNDCLSHYEFIYQEGVKKYPIGVIDSDFCKRVEYYSNIAKKENDTVCIKDFGSVHSGKCKKVESRHQCPLSYRYSCEYVLFYFPIQNPDKNHCGRIESYISCAQLLADDDCLEAFEDIQKNICKDPLKCEANVPTYCPQGLKEFPLSTPDVNYCKRLYVYLKCVMNIYTKCRDYIMGQLKYACLYTGQKKSESYFN